MSILTPEQIATLAYALEWDKPMSDTDKIDLARTITAYADIVKKVAEKDPYDHEFSCCIWCNVHLVWRHGTDMTIHRPECVYWLARELRGL